jgi:alkylation response protein AidB-like acyl-CoA dehydrogenase
VRVPVDGVLGDVNQAWSQVWFGQGGEALDPPGPAPDPWQFRILRLLNQVIAHCRQTTRGGLPLSEDPVIRLKLAELITGVELIKLNAYESYSKATSSAAGGGRGGRSDLSQVYYKEFWPHLAQTCMEIVGPLAQLKGGRWAQLDGQVQQFFRASFGNHAGGTAQLKRMALATRGLGLPR